MIITIKKQMDMEGFTEEQKIKIAEFVSNELKGRANQEEGGKEYIETDSYKSFARLLLKTDYEANTEVIYKFLISFKDDVLNFEELSKKIKLESLEIAETLLVFKTNKNPIIKVIGEKSYSTISNNKLLLKRIEKKTEQSYKDRGLDYRPLTMEEAKKELKRVEINYGWIGCYLLDGFKGNFDDFKKMYMDEDGTYKFTIDERMIQEYMEYEGRQTKITEEQIKYIIHCLTEDLKTMTKRGAKRKNGKIYDIISVFKRKGSVRCSHLSNNDCRIIYECLNFFNYIPKELKKNWEKIGNKNAGMQYIKSIVRRSGT